MLTQSLKLRRLIFWSPKVCGIKDVERNNPNETSTSGPTWTYQDKGFRFSSVLLSRSNMSRYEPSFPWKGHVPMRLLSSITQCFQHIHTYIHTYIIIYIYIYDHIIYIEGLTPPAADPGPFCGSDKANGNLSKRSIASFCRHGCGYRSWKWFQSCTELLFTFEAAMFSGLRAAVDVGMWWNIWELIKKTMWSWLIYILSVQWDCFEEFGRHGVHLSAASNGIKLQVSSGHERAVVVDVEGLERWGWRRRGKTR